MLSDSDDNNDSDFEPDDDDNSYASSEDSDYNPLDDADDAASLPGTIAGVDDAAGARDPAEPTGLDNAVAQTTIEPPMVDDDANNDDAAHEDDDEESNDVAQAELETFVNELETALDDEIDEIEQLNNDYRSGNDDNHEPNADIGAAVTPTLINNHELDDIHADAARQQSSADNDVVTDDNNEEPNDDEDSDPHTPRPRLRRNRTRCYGHLKGRPGNRSLPTVAQPHEFRGGKHQAHVILQSIIMTQYNLKQGIKKFGDSGKAAVLVELQQLYDRNVMEPVMKADLTPAEGKGALRYLMFIKERRCGKIKGRGCADGRSQREYMSKEETSSPTVATEALILTCVIDAIEGRDVATCDIPGAFMQSDMKGKVMMKLEGVMAEVIIKIDPKLYTKVVAKEKRQGRYICHLNQGTIWNAARSTALFWQNLSTKLKKWGFETNSYNFCIANKTINGKQCTVVWHVDDLKIYHVDAKGVTSILNLLDAKYGQEIVGGEQAALTINRGRIHDYLGMTLDYSEPGYIKLNMVDYVNKILKEMPHRRQPSTYSRLSRESRLWTTGPGSEFFHATVAKLLFLCKRGRPDIQTAIAFLCTRVQQPTRHDYNKLERVIKYLRATRKLVLRLSAGNLIIIKWWIDASYGVHHDMRSHTRGTMSMGTGAVYSTSRRQKLNTKNSTKAGLVDMGDVLPQALWTKYFMEPQGYGVTTILNQDNQSTIKLSDNGKASSGKGARHINIPYFFITDRIARKEVAIQYCPTKEMVADYFTKPLQGELFYKFRDQIMGVDPMDTITGDHRSVLDVNSDKPKLAKKHAKVSPLVNHDARPNRAQPMKTTRHQSWVDVVKSRPPKDLKWAPKFLLKR
jgi:hypothetical protein